jgi:hypothetical protein
MFTFPADRTAGHGVEFAIVCSDPLAAVPVPVFDLFGNTIPASQIAPNQDGLWPLFTCAVQPVYVQVPTGEVLQMSATDNRNEAALVVTGSRGGNTALASLISALVAANFPISDQTTL